MDIDFLLSLYFFESRSGHTEVSLQHEQSPGPWTEGVVDMSAVSERNRTVFSQTSSPMP